MERLAKIMYTLSFVTLFIVYSFWSYFKEVYGIQIYYIGIAAAIAMLFYCIHILHEKNKYLTEVFYLAAVNNLLDEIFFNPKEVSVNEYIGFLLIIIIVIYKWDKNQKRCKS